MNRPIFLAICTLALVWPTVAGHAAETTARCDDNKAARFFDRVDANRDGRVTEDEMIEMRLSLVARADTNGDGVLSRDEFAAVGRTRGGAKAESRFARYDSDNSGTVTPDEIAGARAAMLSRVDADGDGAVSREELRAVRGCDGSRAPLQ